MGAANPLFLPTSGETIAQKCRHAAFCLARLTITARVIPSGQWLPLAAPLGSVKTCGGLCSLAPESFNSVLDHKVGREVVSCSSNAKPPRKHLAMEHWENEMEMEMEMGGREGWSVCVVCVCILRGGKYIVI